MTAAKKKKAKPKNKASSAKAAAAHRRKLFVEALLSNGGNQTQAAISAGFSKKTAYSQGHALMKHSEVAAAIEARKAELSARYAITTENILRELGRVALFDPAKCYHPKTKKPLAIPDIDEDTRRALAGVGKDGEIKAFGKNEAMRTALQYLNVMPGRGVSVKVAAQSNASAEVQQLPQEQLSDYEVARRVAYVLAQGAKAKPEPLPAPPTPSTKQAA